MWRTWFVPARYAILHKVNAVNTDSYIYILEKTAWFKYFVFHTLASMTRQLAILQAVPRKPENYGTWPLALGRTKSAEEFLDSSGGHK